MVKKVKYNKSTGGSTHESANIILYGVPNYSTGTHPHNYKDTWHEGVHPHREYVACSCGATKYTGNTVYLSECSLCGKPGKPALKNMSERYINDYNKKATVSFIWDSTSDTTHYKLYIEQWDVFFSEYDNYYTDTSVMSGFEYTFKSEGKYRAKLQSINSNSTDSETGEYKTSDGDWVYFEVIQGVSWTVEDSELTIFGNGSFDESAYEELLNYKDSITSIDIDRTITSFDIDFSSYPNLETLYIMAEVEALPPAYESMIYECNKLKDIMLPSTLLEINSAYISAPSLEEIWIGGNDYFTSMNGVLYDKLKTKIIKFPSARNVKSYTLPNRVKTLGTNAFDGCMYLEEIVLPDGMTKFEDGSIQNCPELRKISIPSSVKEIGASLFSNCDLLEEIIVPEGVTHIGSSFASGCDKLKTIRIPSTVMQIDGTIGSSGKNKDINVFIDEKNPYYLLEGSTIFNKDKTKLCQYLGADTRYFVPDGVCTIAGRAFWSARVENIYIPRSVKNIEAYAFSYVGMENVYYEGTEAEWNNIDIVTYDDHNMSNTGLLSAERHFGYEYKNTIVVDETLKVRLTGNNVCGKVYTTLYNNDKIREVKSYPATEYIDLKFNNATKGDLVKIMWWGDNMTPLCEAKTITIK